MGTIVGKQLQIPIWYPHSLFNLSPPHMVCEKLVETVVKSLVQLSPSGVLVEIGDTKVDPIPTEVRLILKKTWLKVAVTVLLYW